MLRPTIIIITATIAVACLVLSTLHGTTQAQDAWSANWSAYSLAQGTAITLTLTGGDNAADSDTIFTTLQVGREEGTTHPDAITVTNAEGRARS